MSGLARVPGALLVAFVVASSSTPSFSATINAEMDKFIDEDVVVRIEGPILPGDAERLATLVLPLRRQDTVTYLWLYVTINSDGGSVSEALKIGRFLRRHSASVQFRQGDQCLSSCVFILMAGVVRVTHLVDAVVGVHRPFLLAADQDQDFERAYRETRSDLEAYFDEMRVSRQLFPRRVVSKNLFGGYPRRFCFARPAWANRAGMPHSRDAAWRVEAGQDHG